MISRESLGKIVIPGIKQQMDVYQKKKTVYTKYKHKLYVKR